MYPLNANSFGELLAGSNLIVYLALSVSCGLMLFLCSLKFLLVLQQSGYRGKRYLKWLTNPETPYLSRLMILCLLGFLFFSVLCVCFQPLFGKTACSYLGFVSFFLFSILYINSERHVNVKVPLRKTKRLVRLCITYFILLLAVVFGFIILLNYLAFVIGNEVFAMLRYALVCVLPILSPYLLLVAYAINQPIEETIKNRITKKATEKLDKTNVIKIAITGSYGKTSVKEILKTILSQKFRVLATPYSYNTPMGIALTVKNLDSTHDVFIAEMGARYKNDVKVLTQMVKPQIGILTGINNQHLETMGSIENVMKIKNELFTNMQDGKGYFSFETEGARKLYEEYQGEKYSVNEPGGEAYATDVSRDEFGMTFKLHLKGEEPVTCHTILLGSHSVKNICLASAVAHGLGLSPEEISRGVSRIKAIGHRLELLPNNKGIIIIDDSYNSNQDGASAAMEVLSSFNGRKIVLTPGLVELGKDENLANFNFGKTLAKHADKVIVIGKHNAEMIINGLIEGGMDKSDISFCKNLNKGNELLNGMLRSGDVVLFENDLPDNYN